MYRILQYALLILGVLAKRQIFKANYGYIGPACAVVDDALFVHGARVRNLTGEEKSEFAVYQKNLNLFKRAQEVREVAEAPLIPSFCDGVDDSTEVVLKGCVVRNYHVYQLETGNLMRPLTNVERQKIESVLNRRASKTFTAKTMLRSRRRKREGFSQPEDISDLIHKYLKVNSSVTSRFLPVVKQSQMFTPDETWGPALKKTGNQNPLASVLENFAKVEPTSTPDRAQIPVISTENLPTIRPLSPKSRMTAPPNESWRVVSSTTTTTTALPTTSTELETSDERKVAPGRYSSIDYKKKPVELSTTETATEPKERTLSPYYYTSTRRSFGSIARKPSRLPFEIEIKPPTTFETKPVETPEETQKSPEENPKAAETLNPFEFALLLQQLTQETLRGNGILKTGHDSAETVEDPTILALIARALRENNLSALSELDTKTHMTGQSVPFHTVTNNEVKHPVAVCTNIGNILPAFQWEPMPVPSAQPLSPGSRTVIGGRTYVAVPLNEFEQHQQQKQHFLKKTIEKQGKPASQMAFRSLKRFKPTTTDMDLSLPDEICQTPYWNY